MHMETGGKVMCRQRQAVDDVAIARESQEPPEARQGKKGISPEPLSPIDT